MRHSCSAVLLALLVGPLASGAAVAADTFLAIEATSMTVDDIDSDDLNPIGGRLRLGTKISDLFGVEGHVGYAIDDDNAFGDETELTTLGAYLKAYLPIGYNSSLFGTAGYVRVDADVRNAPLGIESSRSHSGLGWGVGLETRLTDRIDLTADYMRFEVDEDEGETFPSVATVSFGIKLYL